jgi:hypothetical protein
MTWMCALLSFMNGACISEQTGAAVGHRRDVDRRGDVARRL